MSRGVLTIAPLAVVLTWLAPAVPPASGQSLSQTAKCGVFYDKWEVPGAPVGALVMAGLGHEALAANDCVAQNKPEAACEHYSRAERALAKIAQPLATQMSADLSERKRELGCK